MATHALLFMASVALWTWSHREPRSWYVQRISRQDPPYVHLWAYSARGTLRLHTARSIAFQTPTWEPRWHFGREVGNSGEGRPMPTWLGFGADALTDAGYQHRMLLIPYWFITPALATAPTLRLLTLRRQRRRRQRGLCPACGYDLRATPERCPECVRCQRGRMRTFAECIARVERTSAGRCH